MPSINLYAAAADVALIEAAFRQSSDIARITLDEDGLWRAHRDFAITQDGRYCFWHVASGPLPNSRAGEMGEPKRWVKDPFEGWKHERLSQHGLPFFSNDTGIFWLNLRVVDERTPEMIGLSTIEWIGGHFSAIGRVPLPETRRRWAKLKRDLDKAGERVPRGGPAGTGKSEIIALPAARAAMSNGQAAATAPSLPPVVR